MESRGGDAQRKRRGTPAPTTRRGRKPTDPSPPLPSVRTGPGDGGALTARRRPGAAALLPLAPPPSGLEDAGAPATSRMRRKPTASSLAPPPPSLRRGPGDGDSTRKRTGSPLPRRRRRTVAEGNSGSGGGHPTGGSPDAPPAPTASPPRISVAHTPNVPPRFEALLKNVTYLIPYYESKGKSHKCILSRMNAFLSWSKSKMGLFFEWNDDEEEATCWMHDIVKKKHFKFTVNAAFSHEMDAVNVERAAVAFSTNFIGGDEYWSDLKDMLFNMFGSFEDKGLKEYDYLYVFTRVGSSVYFRHFKILSLPKADDPSSGLVLIEINTMFCLKLVSDQGTPTSSNIGPQLPNDQPPTKLILCPVTIHSISNGQTGFCLSHEVVFSEKIYSVHLQNGSFVSSLQKLEGCNISLAEIVVLEPLLKMKHIIGSATNKTYCFARERCKSVLQSLFAEFAMLLESGKCVSEAGNILMHHVLVRGTNVRLYGVELTDYTEHLAKLTVNKLVRMVRNCFPSGMIPPDLDEFLADLEKNPLDQIRLAKDDCSLMKAEDRWMLLIKIHSEYMTTVKAKSPGTDEIDDGQINDITFFDDCPYVKEWKQIMEDNEYLVQICNLHKSSDQGNGSDEVKNPAVVERMKRKARMSKNTSSIQKYARKKKQAVNEGKLQFTSKRNFNMRMPEMARKDGIFPFRLGMADHILTAYFPLYLRFVQRRMREVKEQDMVGPSLSGRIAAQQKVSVKDKCKKRKRRQHSPAAQDTPELG